MSQFEAAQAPADADGPRDIGALGALSIGIGGIVGGGFFATFGLAVVGARGSTFLSFLLGGAVALLTAYSYVGLSLRFPDPAGTAGFVRRAFGRSLLPASVNVLLIYSYVCVMAVYAHAFGAYGASYFPADRRALMVHLLASAAILLLGAINYAGAALMAKFEGVFNIGKLGALIAFIAAGLLMGAPDWSRLGPAHWESAPRIVSSGIMAFLSYEGFELISNASPRIRHPSRTLPLAFYGSVAAAILIYVSAIVVAIGHMPFDAMAEAQSFALSATAERFMGPFGFALMTAAALLASASAINADFFGASQLPALLAEQREAWAGFTRRVAGRPVVSMAFVGGVALFAVNCVDLPALSAATSAGFLVVFAAVNLANMRLARETGAARWIAILGAVVCVVALAVTLYDFIANPAMRASAAGMVAIVLISIAAEQTYRSFWGHKAAGGKDRVAALSATMAVAAVAAVGLAAFWPPASEEAARPAGSHGTAAEGAGPQTTPAERAQPLPPVAAPAAPEPTAAPAPQEPARAPSKKHGKRRKG